MRPGGDHFTLLNVFTEWVDTAFSIGWTYENFVQVKSLNRVRDIRDQLSSLCERVEIVPESNSDSSDIVPIQKSILSGEQCCPLLWPGLADIMLPAGYFYNCAQLSRSGDSYKTFKTQQTVYIHPSSSLFNNQPPVRYINYFELVLTSKEYARSVMEFKPVCLNFPADYWARLTLIFHAPGLATRSRTPCIQQERYRGRSETKDAQTDQAVTGSSGQGKAAGHHVQLLSPCSLTSAILSIEQGSSAFLFSYALSHSRVSCLNRHRLARRSISLAMAGSKEDGAASLSTAEPASSTSRLSKLLGLSPSKKGATREAAASRDLNDNDDENANDDGEDSSMLVEPPTPGLPASRSASNGQTRGRGTSYSGTPTKSRSSVYLSNILAGPHPAAESDARSLTSATADGNKGKAKLARMASKDASTWRLPSWSSPSKQAAKESQAAGGLSDGVPTSATSAKSVGLVMGPQVQAGESVNSDMSGSSNSARISTSDVVDEGISMSDTTGKVGQSACKLAFFADNSLMSQ